MVRQESLLRILLTDPNSQKKSFLTSHLMPATPLHQAGIFYHQTTFEFRALDGNCIHQCTPAPDLIMSIGDVLASTIMTYLQTMTDQSPEQDRLSALQSLLDPDGSDPPVSRDTFHSTMRAWISHCSQDG